MIGDLLHDGFSRVEVDDTDTHNALERGLDEASQLEGFRFPPINTEHPPPYNQARREAFTALFDVATICLRALLTPRAPRVLNRALDEINAPQFKPFMADERSAESDPFAKGHPFHPSFFNLFNYDHGALNSHLDRSLLTIIKVRPRVISERSSLWVANRSGRWTNGDRVVSEGGKRAVIVMIGEDGARLPFAADAGLYPAEHCVRLNPEGMYIERSHHRHDPEAHPTENRLSAAFILRCARFPTFDESSDD
jgi:hypothetical protein